jgi:hypothetical protein
MYIDVRNGFYRRTVACIAIFGLTLSLVGCGGESVDDKFKGQRGTVSGKVTFKGQPVPANSTILFQSKEGGYSAGGTINGKGEYSLSYNGASTMPAVLYKVQFGPPPVKAETMDPAKVVSGGAPTAAPPPFPAKFSDFATSGQEYTVKAGANVANFDLVE